MISEGKDEVASHNASRSTPKNTKQSKRIVLRLPTTLLTRFPHDPIPQTAPESKPTATVLSSDTPGKSQDATSQSSASDDKTSSAPQPDGGDGAPTVDGQKRKSLPGPKPGSKRSAPADTDGTPKPKGRPGPKKKKTEGENGTSGPGPAAHKLGPKANQGAINAGLRALDRSGKACRKWNKKGIALKTFTGVNWDLPYWQTPKMKSAALTGDIESETTGSSDAKIELCSSAVGSERSSGGKEANSSIIPAATVTASSPVGQQSEEATPAS